jgi:uncharacterized protein YdaU (DUF1376 family)
MTHATPRSVRIDDKLFLVCQAVPGPDVAPAAKPVRRPTDHLVVVDCSGSMSGDLPQVCEQLKKKLPTMLGNDDTISIVWFSGRGQFGTLLEAEPVAGLTDLQRVHAAIDRWLRPVGLTGFKEPLEEVKRLVDRIRKKRPSSAFSLFFMSDGCDNQWSRPEILKAVEAAAGGLASSTFVEYGYYADRALLAAMAEKAGGQLIFADRFDKYEPVFEAAMKQRQPMTDKRVTLTIHGDPIGGFDWSMNQEGASLVAYGVESGTISVPEGTREVWYLSPTSIGEAMLSLAEIAKTNAERALGATDCGVPILSAAYAAVSLFSVRMRPEVILPILGALGDVGMIHDFGGLFGKQRYSEFMDQAKRAAFDASVRYAKGYDPKALPKDDAFTVLDMLRLLASDDANKILFEHPGFTYSRISRKRIDADVALSDEERAEIDALTKAMQKTKDASKVKALTAQVDAITEKKKPLVFTTTPSPEGYAVENLTYNQENPNISVLLRKEGTVDIRHRRPDALAKALPDHVPTFIWRNYAIVKNGLVNVETMPCMLSNATIASLMREAASGRLPDDVLQNEGNGVMFLHFGKLPVINRAMVRSTSAKTLFENEWALLKDKAQQKVYNTLLKNLGKRSASHEELYGKEAADWLVSQGFGDNGFEPKKVEEEAKDFFMTRELRVKVKSYSSIPSVNEYQKQLAKKDPAKLTPAASLMTPAIEAVKGHETDRDWLKAEQKKLDRARRGHIIAKAQTVFTTIVGQSWFSEFASIEESSMSLTIDGRKLDFSVELAEEKVEI